MNRYAIIGYGKFGSQLASDLIKFNIPLKICDNDEDKLKDLADVAGVEPIVINCSDKTALEQAGIIPSEVDTVIVSVGDSIETSIISVFALQELGNKNIIVKVVNQIHSRIMLKCGASRTIYPENDAARLLSSELVSKQVESYLISDCLKVCKGLAGSAFNDVSVQDFEHLAVTFAKNSDDEDGNNQNILKIVAIKRAEVWNTDITPNLTLNKTDFIVFLVSTDISDKVILKFER